MEKVKYLVLGAGISGLSFVHFLKSKDYLVLEKENEIGGYCKTVRKKGFIWDYSGHFLHFQNEKLKQYLLDLLDDEILEIKKITKIFFKNRWIDYPFQKNIHQLPKQDFIDCLYYLFFKEKTGGYSNFEDMLLGKFGRGICERFLFPYNEKLYACTLDKLSADAMGRFFPYADLREIISNFKYPQNKSYNADFIYPKRGIFELVKAINKKNDDEKILLNKRVSDIDVDKSVVKTEDGATFNYKYLISTISIHNFLSLVGIESSNKLSYNRVLVFNFGFDEETDHKEHWIYFPSKKLSFYRVGFYDNILNQKKMSLYVEIGFDKDTEIDINSVKEKVLADLKEVGIIKEHKIIAEHYVIMNPAYFHISKESKEFVDILEGNLNKKNIYLLGRYARGDYCSLEDNIIVAKNLSHKLK